MIAVISDLHFEEEARDAIRGKDGDEVSVPRNIPAAAFCRLVANLARAAEQNRADSLKLVLAGDIFELFQTSLWFADEDPVRPYQDSVEEGSALESKILSILDAIAAEEPVAETLALFRLLTAGRYLDDGQEKELSVPASIEYIPGNHDRPCNATRAIRRKVRQMLGMGGSEERFPNYLLLYDPSVLIRHGHEYDAYNFAVDYSDAERIPLHISREHYDSPTLGDFITIEVVARLPVEYRRVHSPEDILRDPTRRAVYKRLLEFEDVRPQSALIPFLLKMPKHGFSDEDIWATLEPVLQNIIDDLHDHPFLHHWLDEWGKAWRPDRSNLTRIALKVLAWREGMSLTEAKAMAWAAGKAEKSVIASVSREEAVQERTVRSIVCGHTHSPSMELATTRDDHECLFFDVGTWRHRLPMAHDESGFGMVKSLTYLILYGAEEDKGEGGDSSGRKLESFDYWSGFSRRYYE
jgi:UDP-2,3-diacylglucosamine pyrophosphatase LpxH